MERPRPKKLSIQRKPLPASASESEDTRVEADVARLCEMFPELEPERALEALLDCAGSVAEAATRLGEECAAAAAPADVTPPRGLYETLMALADALGPAVPLAAVEEALAECDGDADRAAQWLLDGNSSIGSTAAAAAPSVAASSDTGEERFEVHSVEDQSWYLDAVQLAEALDRMEEEDAAFARRLALEEEDEELARKIEASERKAAAKEAEEETAAASAESIPRSEGGDVPSGSLARALNADAVLGKAIAEFEQRGIAIDGFRAVNSKTARERFMEEWRKTEHGKRILAIAFHGTSTKNFESIERMGLVVPGESNTVKIAHGKALGVGIYLALDPTMAQGYAAGTGPNIFVCLVLLGTHFVSSHSGAVLVVRSPARVLPLWALETKGISECISYHRTTSTVATVRTPAKPTKKEKRMKRMAAQRNRH